MERSKNVEEINREIADRRYGLMIFQMLSFAPLREREIALDSVGKAEKGVIVDFLMQSLPDGLNKPQQLLIYNQPPIKAVVDRNLGRVLEVSGNGASDSRKETVFCEQEFDVLLTLLASLGKPLSAEQIITKTRLYRGMLAAPVEADEELGKVVIYELRKRLNSAYPDLGGLITTHRKLGYSFNVRASGLLAGK